MKRRGFTLLELSVVLTLIAVIVGGGLVIGNAFLQKRQLDTTIANMDAIEDAIVKFSVAYNRIPCPGDMTLPPSNASYGMEAGAGGGSAIATGTGVCSGTGMVPQANFVSSAGVSEGGVPIRALQLPDSYLYDGWGRRLRYAVDPTMTLSTALPVPVGGVSCPASSPVTVYDSTGSNPRTTGGAYALMSHGVKGHGAYTRSGAINNGRSTNTAELANCHCNSSGVATGTYAGAYVAKAITIDPSDDRNSFDDIVTFKEPWQIQTPNSPLAVAANSCFYIAVTGYSGELRIMSFSNNKLTDLPTMSAPSGAGKYIDFSIDNKYLGWAGEDSSNYTQGMLYNVSSSGLSGPTTFYTTSSSPSTDSMNQIKFSPDGNYFVYGGYLPNMQINVYSGGNWSTAATFQTAPAVQYWGFAWSPDSATLYASEDNGGGGNNLHFIDVFSHSVISTRFDIIPGKQIDARLYGASNTANRGTTKGLSVHPSGNYLAAGVYQVQSTSGNYYHPIVIANPPTASSAGSPTRITAGLKNYSSGEISYQVAWSPNGNYLALSLTTYSQGFDVYQFDSTSNVFTASTVVGASCNPGRSIAWSKDSNYLAVGSSGSSPLCIYARSGNTFTNLNVSNTLPVSQPLGIVWSK